MISPGSKGWINKYFRMIESEEITIVSRLPKEMSEEEYLHFEMSRTGLIFGIPSKRLYTNHLEDSKWTEEEGLKVLLFESFIEVYFHKHKGFNAVKFIESLNRFYENYNPKGFSKVLDWINKPEEDRKIEKILEKRISIHKTFDNKVWVNYLNNSLVYLDVLLYRTFLSSSKHTLEVNYQEKAEEILKAIILAVISDDEIDERETMLFHVFLASANLSDTAREAIEERFKKKDLKLTDLNIESSTDWLFKQYMLDLCALTIFADNKALDQEIMFLHDLCNYLKIENEELHQSIGMIETFVLENQGKVSFLQDNSSLDKLYDNLSKRWIKILGRNKDKLAKELKQSKELVSLINKSRKTDLTPEEKEKVKTQFTDIVKSMPALAIFMLPGGALLLPIVLKVIPNLIPSAFKENH